MANADKCYLHIPHKEWADDPRERENYSTIERWANECGGSCGCYIGLYEVTSTLINNNLGQNPTYSSPVLTVPDSFSIMAGSYRGGNCMILLQMFGNSFDTPHSQRKTIILPSVGVGFEASDLGSTVLSTCSNNVTGFVGTNETFSARFSTDAPGYRVIFNVWVKEICGCATDFNL